MHSLVHSQHAATKRGHAVQSGIKLQGLSMGVAGIPLDQSIVNPLLCQAGQQEVA